MPRYVTLERPRDGVALVTMTHPEILNMGSFEAIEELADALTAAREGGARVSVIASGVPGHWLEHAWLKDLHALFTGGTPTASGAGWFRCLQELASPVVSIAAISGDTAGGGCELGWACDLRVAEEQATFAQPEVRIGLATGLGGTCRLARLVGRTVAAEMVLEGAPVSARRLYELGGVNRVVPEGRAVPVALEWAARLADRDPAALATLKRMLVANDEGRPIDEALAREQKLFQESAAREPAITGMARVQERYDAGETPRDVYGAREPDRAPGPSTPFGRGSE